MINKLAFATAGVLAMLAIAPANALTLINNDDATYEVTAMIGEGDATMDTFELASGANRADFCEEGCLIRLNNGAEQSFQGDEIVTIKDGGFVMAE